MRLKQLKNSLILLLTATIWGLAFVAQSASLDHVPPFMFVFIRNVIAVIVLLPVALLVKNSGAENEQPGFKPVIKGGILCGLALGLASCLQQYGMLYTTVGKAGFLTTLYIVMTPVAGLFLGRKCPKLTWIAVLLSLIGVYLLSMAEQTGVNRGDIAEILCAVVFTIQILLVDRFNVRVNVYKLACVQFATVAVFSLLLSLAFGETVSFADIRSAWLPILYTGVLSSGVAYTLQIVGQRGLNPTLASLIMSLESSIATLSGWLILHQALSVREFIGCVLMFAAIVLAQLRQN